MTGSAARSSTRRTTRKASWLLVALAAGCAKAAQEPSAPHDAHGAHDIAIAKVDAGAGAVETTGDAGGGASKREQPPIDAGWVTGDYKTGRIDPVGREKALVALRQAPARVLVRVMKIIEECSSVGGSHVFVEPAFSKESPFRIAHFGGHGSHVVHAKGSLFGDPEQLYVAAVETHPPSSFGNGRGFCLEDAPSYDADVLAIVPVRSEGEGMRLLTDLAR